MGTEATRKSAKQARQRRIHDVQASCDTCSATTGAQARAAGWQNHQLSGTQSPTHIYMAASAAAPVRLLPASHPACRHCCVAPHRSCGIPAARSSSGILPSSASCNALVARWPARLFQQEAAAPDASSKEFILVQTDALVARAHGGLDVLACARGCTFRQLHSRGAGQQQQQQALGCMHGRCWHPVVQQRSMTRQHTDTAPGSYAEAQRLPMHQHWHGQASRLPNVDT